MTDSLIESPLTAKEATEQSESWKDLTFSCSPNVIRKLEFIQQNHKGYNSVADVLCDCVNLGVLCYFAKLNGFTEVASIRPADNCKILHKFPQV